MGTNPLWRPHHIAKSLIANLAWQEADSRIKDAELIVQSHERRSVLSDIFNFTVSWYPNLQQIIQITAVGLYLFRSESGETKSGGKEQPKGERKSKIKKKQDRTWWDQTWGQGWEWPLDPGVKAEGDEDQDMDEDLDGEEWDEDEWPMDGEDDEN